MKVRKNTEIMMGMVTIAVIVVMGLFVHLVVTKSANSRAASAEWGAWYQTKQTAYSLELTADSNFIEGQKCLVMYRKVTIGETDPIPYGMNYWETRREEWRIQTKLQFELKFYEPEVSEGCKEHAKKVIVEWGPWHKGHSWRTNTHTYIYDFAYGYTLHSGEAPFRERNMICYKLNSRMGVKHIPPELLSLGMRSVIRDMCRSYIG